uniref:RRM domain-containing protein n=1 Tax=Oryza meridionalis TaxID=40149 RepID=A0A0E0EEM0_9ORYZ
MESTLITITRSPILPCPSRRPASPSRCFAGARRSRRAAAAASFFSPAGARGGGDAGAGSSLSSAAAALGEAAAAGGGGSDSEAILLSVQGMMCDGCAASVKRILESQPEVTSATVDFKEAKAVVLTTAEVKAAEDWQKQCGEKLANHLGTCGFESRLQGGAYIGTMCISMFIEYGEVVDIYIPRDRRTGDSRGFAFVRYKYEDEAQKAVDRLDGRVVDGREIMVQFAKYGPNAERIHKGKIMETVPRSRGRSRSRSPRQGYRYDYRERDYRKRSRSRDRYGRDRYRERDYRRRSRSRSYTPDDYRRRGRDSVSPARRSLSRSRSRSYSPDDYRKRGKHSQSPVRKSPSAKRSPSMSPARRSPSALPARRSPSASPVRRSPSRSPRRTPSSQEGSPVKRYDEPRRSRSPSTMNGVELLMSRGCSVPDDGRLRVNYVV